MRIDSLLPTTSTGQVQDQTVFGEGRENEQNANEYPQVDGLHVGHLRGQAPRKYSWLWLRNELFDNDIPNRVEHGGQGQESCHTQDHATGNNIGRDQEGQPSHDHEDDARDVSLSQVVPNVPLQSQSHSQSWIYRIYAPD